MWIAVFGRRTVLVPYGQRCWCNVDAVVNSVVLVQEVCLHSPLVYAWFDVHRFTVTSHVRANGAATSRAGHSLLRSILWMRWLGTTGFVHKHAHQFDCASSVCAQLWTVLIPTCDTHMSGSYCVRVLLVNQNFLSIRFIRRQISL
jgi:hypothetical protein